MVLRIFNTMSGVEEEFKPIHGNRVNMFVCGPTVYDYSHVGHARTYVVYDIIARYLRFKGYSLFYLMNITDVDDKIIDRAKEKNIDPLTLSREFTREFMYDMDRLNISSVNLYAKASEHIPEIISQIECLLERGYAYVVDGDVYFDISKFPDYGKLSHQKPEELKKHRIEPDPRKRDPSDFSLWKSRRRDELGWESPWGWGRPGWHIEDTAITTTYLGAQYDIHGGAIELVFPHHEAEIAQAESATGKKPLVKYWIHTGMVNVRGQKMSKSLGNFVTVRDVLERYDPNTLRIFVITSHYRSPIDYNEDNLREAGEKWRRIWQTYVEAEGAMSNSREGVESYDLEFMEATGNHWSRFIEAMDDDFNTPVALSVILSYVRGLEAYVRKGPERNTLSRSLEMMRSIFNILGLKHVRPENGVDKTVEGLIKLIIDLRDEARRRGDWETADGIRERLKKFNIILEDTPGGTIWKRMF
ncbi:MAG: cysteine--tRNA ligase [Candidatus Bathyarchaeia archaeon]|nr:cysteine--tRNA ligase [Candidatus Bathyarchaeota archaeon]